MVLVKCHSFRIMRKYNRTMIVVVVVVVETFNYVQSPTRYNSHTYPQHHYSPLAKSILP